MKKTIENLYIRTTSRLVLAPLREADTYLLHMILTDEFVRRYMYNRNIILLSHTKQIIDTARENFRHKKYGLWLIIDRTTQETIGITGLWDFFDEPQPQIIYALLPRFWKKGFALEAASEVIRYAFEELGYHYLIGSCDASDIYSMAVMERLSMEKIKEEIINYKKRVFFKILPDRN